MPPARVRLLEQAQAGRVRADGEAAWLELPDRPAVDVSALARPLAADGLLAAAGGRWKPTAVASIVLDALEVAG